MPTVTAALLLNFASSILQDAHCLAAQLCNGKCSCHRPHARLMLGACTSCHSHLHSGALVAALSDLLTLDTLSAKLLSSC